VAGAFVATGTALGVVAARGPSPPSSMDDRVRQVAQTLRCPVCVDLSVADSPSLAARQMRGTIRRLLHRGRSSEEIRDYFLARFGPTILLTPRGDGIDLVAWIAPALLVALGLGLLALTLRRWSRTDPAAAPTHGIAQADRELLDRELRGDDEMADGP
jgi:cytochrome c-type biogenesis protein CcmH